MPLHEAGDVVITCARPDNGSKAGMSWKPGQDEGMFLTILGNFARQLDPDVTHVWDARVFSAPLAAASTLTEDLSGDGSSA